MNSLQST